MEVGRALRPSHRHHCLLAGKGSRGGRERCTEGGHRKEHPVLQGRKLEDVRRICHPLVEGLGFADRLRERIHRELWRPPRHESQLGIHRQLQGFGSHQAHRNHQRQCPMVRRPFAGGQALQEGRSEGRIGQGYHRGYPCRRLVSGYRHRYQPSQLQLDT